MIGYDESFFIADSAGNVVQDPTLTVMPGTPITFTISVQSQHPFLISTSNSSVDPAMFVSELTQVSGCVPGQTSSGNPVQGSWVTAAMNAPCVLSYTPSSSIVDAPVYYHCLNHPDMTGMIQMATSNNIQTIGGTQAGPGPIKSGSHMLMPTLMVSLITIASFIKHLF